MEATEIISQVKEVIEKMKVATPTNNELVVPFKSILNHNPELAEELHNNYDEFKTATQCAADAVYDLNNQDINVRFTGLPDSMGLDIGRIRKDHINLFYKFEGTILKMSDNLVTPKRQRFECPSCFPKGTMVLTASGFRPIEQADNVISIDHLGRPIPVESKIIPTGMKDVWCVNDIKCSGNHQWFVYRGGNVQVIQTKDLNIGDTLLKVYDRSMRYLWEREQKSEETNLLRRMQKKKLFSFSNWWRKDKNRQSNCDRTIQYGLFDYTDSEYLRNQPQINKEKADKIQRETENIERTMRDKCEEGTYLQAWKKMWGKKISKIGKRKFGMEMRNLWGVEGQKQRIIGSPQGFESLQQFSREFDGSMSILPYKVTSLSRTTEKVEMYDLQVPLLNNFILHNGVITHNCGNLIWILQTGDKLLHPDRCGCGRKGKFRLISTEWVNERHVVVEEYITDYTDKKTRPDTIKVILRDNLTGEDLIKKIQPGKHIFMNALIKVKQKLPNSAYFVYELDANDIKVEDISLFTMTVPKKLIKEFQEMKNNPNLLKDITNSIFEGIEGQDVVKEILAVGRARGVKTYHRDGKIKHRDTINVFMIGNPGGGKCFKRGTEMLMYNGTIKKVEDIVCGDLLMGDDSKPRKVTSLARGHEQMYDIIPVKGDKYTVNESHIISLRGTSKDRKYYNEKVDVPVLGYLNMTKTEKHILKGYRVPVNFPKKKVKIEPYFLGLWLGDGRSNSQPICNCDKEVQKYIYSYAKRLDSKVSIHIDKRNPKSNSYSIVGKTKYGCGKLLKWLRDYNLIDSKHIPFDYKTNDENIRLELLAGLIDSDGYLHHNNYEIVQKNKVLSEDIMFLARSLGLASYMSEKIIKEETYYRISILGKVSRIPVRVKHKKAKERKQKKDVLVTGVKVEPVGVGDYYGFTIEGNNHRFLLKDFTVVHNTEVAKLVAKVDPISMVVSGKGVSGVGLTGATIFDKQLGCWCVEPGAVPRCNKGSIVIDELDKIEDKDTSSLNEGMTNLSFMIAKAGQQIPMLADVNIIGCANPDGRKFDNMIDKYKQITLKPDFLDRFDIWLAVDKITETEASKRVVGKIIDGFRSDDKRTEKAKYDLPFLQYYYAWIIQNFNPVIEDDVKEYATKEISQMMARADNNEASKEISYRLVANIMRFAIAIAKIHQCDKVQKEHIDRSIAYQKYGFQSLDMLDDSGNISEEKIQFETPVEVKRKKYNLYDFIKKLSEDEYKGEGIDFEELYKRWVAEGNNETESEFEEIINKLKQKGDLFEPKAGRIKPI